MLKEFKEFAVKGNVVDMAVGVMIGAAFSTIVKSLVDDVVMPPLSLLTGELDFTNTFWVLREGTGDAPYATLAEAKAAGATVLAFGQFLNALLTFLLIALVLFFIVRWINRLRSPDTPPAPNAKPCPFCTMVVNIKASRCPHCTSELADKAPEG